MIENIKINNKIRIGVSFLAGSGDMGPLLLWICGAVACSAMLPGSVEGGGSGKKERRHSSYTAAEKELIGSPRQVS